MFVCECKIHEKSRPSQKIATAVHIAKRAKYITVLSGKTRYLMGSTDNNITDENMVVHHRHTEKKDDKLFI